MGDRVGLWQKVDEMLETLDSWQAAEVAAKVNAEIPDVVSEWLDANRITLLAIEIGHRFRTRRQSAESRKRAAFADAAEAGELAVFLEYAVVDADGTRKRIGDMTGADHRFVAGEYQASSEWDALMAAFHRAIAKRVGPKRTADVLSERQYLAIYDRNLGKEA